MVMFGWDFEVNTWSRFEVEVWSRFVFELVIWPNRLILKYELNPRVLCSFGNVLQINIAKGTMDQGVDFFDQ